MVCLLITITVLSCTGNSSAQTAPSFQQPRFSVRQDAGQLLRRFPRDQFLIFTGPARIPRKEHPWAYVAPFAAAAVILPFDKKISAALPSGHGGVSSTISNAGIGATGAAVGAFYVYGLIKHDDHAHETGVLGAEALMDSFLPHTALSFIFGRYRPFQGPKGEVGEGDFFAHNVYAASFPSGHAMYTWSMAKILADEYPSTPSKLVWYGIATTVAISRVTAREHFPSDVIVGGAIGYLIGRHIFHAHSHRLSGAESSFSTDTPSAQ